MIEAIELSGDSIHQTSFEKVNPLKRLTWISCTSPDSHEITELAKKINVERRYLHMAVDEDEVPKIISLKNGIMVVIKAPSLEDDDMLAHSFAAIIINRYLVTLSSKKLESVSKFKKIPSNELKELFLEGSNALVCEIYSYVIKDYFNQLDKIEDEIDDIEENVVNNPTKSVVSKIFAIKKTLIYFHKALNSNKEVFFNAHSGKYREIDAKSKKLFFELYNESVQLVEMVAIFRDVLTGTLDIYMSSISNSMNEVMKKLTVVASFIMLPTLISGIYGMNFANTSYYNMPELYWKYGYLFAIGLMILSVLGSYIYFKRKKWI